MSRCSVHACVNRQIMEQYFTALELVYEPKHEIEYFCFIIIKKEVINYAKTRQFTGLHNSL